MINRGLLGHTLLKRGLGKIKCVLRKSKHNWKRFFFDIFSFAFWIGLDFCSKRPLKFSFFSCCCQIQKSSNGREKIFQLKNWIFYLTKMNLGNNVKNLIRFEIKRQFSWHIWWKSGFSDFDYLKLVLNRSG